ncbi:MAG: Hpt domain-containing protein [Chloroflexota bacterium]|nr:Hpt domain-containing protein [Chloroflexota bacterium]
MSQDSNAGNERIIVCIDQDIQDLVPGFLERRQKDIETISNALTSGDYDTIRTLGHSMKGSGGGFGFDTITDIGRSIEVAANNRNSEEIQKQIEELNFYLDNIEIEYKSC